MSPTVTSVLSRSRHLWWIFDVARPMAGQGDVAQAARSCVGQAASLPSGLGQVCSGGVDAEQAGSLLHDGLRVGQAASLPSGLGCRRLCLLTLHGLAVGFFLSFLVFPSWAQDNQFADVIAAAQQRMVKVSGARAGTVEGYASGMIISADGKVLTTQGVFLDGSQVQVIMADGRLLPATVIRRDRRLQLSLLDLGIATPEHFDLEQVAPVEQGDWVVAISNAFKVADKDEALSVMKGVVSLRTSIDARLNQRDVAYSGPLILIDAITSNPGAAGGAVLDRHGRLVGMIGRIIDSSETNTRLNYAVPTAELLKFVRAESPTPSVPSVAASSGQPVDLGLKIFTLSGRQAPPYVDRVIPGGMADRAGIQADDLVVSVAGQKVNSVRQFQDAVADLTDDVEIVIVVARKNELVRLSIPGGDETAERSTERGDPAEVVRTDGEITAERGGEQDLAVAKWDPADDPKFAVPPLLRQAIARVRPSVVTIESFGGVTATEGVIGGIRQQGEGNTTGVIISSDGLVVTSLFNFVRSPRIITVILADGQRKVATLLGRDLTRNLCLLQLQDVADLPVAQWVPTAEMAVGQYAISVGVGYGDTRPAVSVGILSAFGRMGGRAIQTDANTSPANYGGPLIDIEGRVLGICVPLSPGGMSASAGVEWYDSGIGFAIPLDRMEWWLERMRAGDDIFPGIIGVTVVDNPQGSGVQVVRTIPNSAAQKAGLQPGDVLTSLGDQAIESQADLLQQVKRLASGDRVDLKLRREDNVLELELVLTPHPDSQPRSLIPGLPPLEELR